MSRFELPIAELSFAQKLDLLEMLWADMSGNEEKLPSPSWHETVLDERAAAFDAGKMAAASWDEAKERIKKNVS